MRSILAFALLGLYVQAAFFNFDQNQERLVNLEIERIDEMIAAGELDHPRAKELELQRAMKLGNERVLEHVVARVCENSHIFSDSDIEYLESEEIASLADDPTVIEKIDIRFAERATLPAALKAARIFRQYGHRIYASLRNPESINLNRDKLILLELIEAGQVDLNREMVKCAKKKLFHLVKFFILNGADVNYWESRYDRSSLLEYCIRRPECDVSIIEFLLMSGAKIVQENATERVEEIVVSPLEIAFACKRYDIVRYLISQNVFVDNLGQRIIRSGHLELFDAALSAKYQFETNDLKASMFNLLRLHEFELVKKLLIANDAEFQSDSKSVTEELTNIFERLKMNENISENEMDFLNNLTETVLQIKENHQNHRHLK